MVGRITFPQRCLILGTYEYVTFMAKGLCRGNKFKNLEMGKLSWIVSRSQYNQCPFLVKGVMVRRIRVRNRFEDVMLLTLKTEKWLWAKECMRPLKTGKGKETHSPLEPQKGMQACQHIDISPVRFLLNFWPIKL